MVERGRPVWEKGCLGHTSCPDCSQLCTELLILQSWGILIPEKCGLLGGFQVRQWSF